MTEFRIKRAYIQPDEKDGKRILVDRLWPRGLEKNKARIDYWWKDIAPSAELRRWFVHDPKRWAEFQARYLEELENNKEQLLQLRAAITDGTATLIFGAKDEKHNNAIVLQSFLRSK